MQMLASTVQMLPYQNMSACSLGALWARLQVNTCEAGQGCLAAVAARCCGSFTQRSAVQRVQVLQDAVLLVQLWVAVELKVLERGEAGQGWWYDAQAAVAQAELAQPCERRKRLQAAPLLSQLVVAG